MILYSRTGVNPPLINLGLLNLIGGRKINFQLTLRSENPTVALKFPGTDATGLTIFGQLFVEVIRLLLLVLSTECFSINIWVGSDVLNI